MKFYADRVYDLAAMSEKDLEALAVKYPQINDLIGDNKQRNIDNLEAEPGQKQDGRKRKRKSNAK